MDESDDDDDDSLQPFFFCFQVFQLALLRSTLTKCDNVLQRMRRLVRRLRPLAAYNSHVTTYFSLCFFSSFCCVVDSVRCGHCTALRPALNFCRLTNIQHRRQSIIISNPLKPLQLLNLYFPLLITCQITHIISPHVPASRPL